MSGQKLTNCAGISGVGRAGQQASLLVLVLALAPRALAQNSALNFDGTNDYVTMDQASTLGAPQFTLEAWIKRDASSWGTSNASTGTGGLQNAVAVITKGRSEDDGSNIDCAYFFGLSSDGRLVADFEQYAAGGGWSAGQNHPMCSSVRIGASDQGWHHVAVTYDKASGYGWRFYLDGAEVTAADGTSVTCGAVSTCTDPSICPQNPGVDPRYDSIQHFALGVALNSTGGNPGGYFGGVMDEVRVWNYARSQAEIVADMGVEITSATGLIGRWGLDEGSGAMAYDSTTPAENGTLTNGPAWTVGLLCANSAECADADACTTDVCDAGLCEYTTTSCPPGQSCNPATGLCEVAPVVVTFQQGVGGYSGAIDTYIQAGSSTSNATAVLLTADGVPPATDERQILIRFDNIFGGGAGQIPSGSTIISATLTVNVSNSIAITTNFHRMLQTWSDTAVWSTFGSSPWNGTPGIQADGVEAFATPDAAPSSIGSGSQSIAVTPSLQAWAATPSGNFGWVLLVAAADSLAFDSSEVTTQANRPKLTVVYIPGCTTDADCSDGLFCNGAEHCNTGTHTCEAGTPPNCDDGIACTADACDEGIDSCTHTPNHAACNDGDPCTNDTCDTVNGCLYTPNTGAACDDNDACTTNDTCNGVNCVGGPPPDCDDNNPCTDDACVSPTGCIHTPDDGNECSDGVACTTDVCDDGVCVSSDNCTGGQMCNYALGECVTPVTATFQQGVSSYSDAYDTYIDAALGSQATTTPIVIDGDPVEQVLIRFDDIFGSGANQIPAGSTIVSATLTLRVGSGANDPSNSPVNFHRLLHPWVDTDVWADYGVLPWNTQGGIQADDQDALAAIEDTATMSSASTAYPVIVTASVQAWSSSPSSNYGWAILPTGTDGLRLESSESTTPSYRPLLTVTYLPSPCDDDLDCNDNNPCTDDACNTETGQCLYTPDDLNACNDGIDCTTDVCDDGVCVSTDNCPTGQVCNHATGLCETPPGLPIEIGATWKYFKGFSEPPAAWTTVSFDDSAWLTDPSGFGYGPDCTAQRSTLLSDMQNPPNSPGYLSLYTRRAFYVADPAGIYSLTLTMYYDDAFVAYINGQEVARSTNIAGTPPAYDAPASSDHECIGPETFTLSTSALVTGTNVIAIQGHNLSLGSSDFTIAPRLEAMAPPNPPPGAPTNPSPPDDATGVSASPDLCVDVSDGNGELLTVTFYGREAAGASGEDFTIIVLPDPQYYAQSYPAIYSAQTQWIVDNRVARNIVFVTGLGDMTNDASAGQWAVADAAFDLLENPATTGLPYGIPYGMCVGNHDQDPSGNARSGTDEGGTTVQYNTWFGRTRFEGRAYFGGNYDFGNPTLYGNNMDNHYELFNAGGMDFIIFHLETDGMGSGYEGTCSTPTCAAVIAWMDDLLTNVYPNRRAIIISHATLQPSGNPPAFMAHGQAIYDAVKDNPNVFLMNCGHLDQANHRADEYPAGSGHWIYTLISDYQTRANGGNGWLRIMTFSPQNDTIHIETYSPTVEGGRYINKPTAHSDNAPNDACVRDCYVEPGGTYAAGGNELLLPYDMDAGDPFVQIEQFTNVPSGSRPCVNWPGRQSGKTHEWYVTVSDGTTTVTGPVWSFTTALTCTTNEDCNDDNPCTDDVCNQGTSLCEYTANSAPCADDGNPCTDDVCSGGACTHPADNTNTCSDGNACTDDACEAGACVSTYAPQPGCCTTNADCDDGNPATDDICVGGTCSNQPVQTCTTDAQCDDSNPCTADACDTANVAAIELNGTSQYINLGNDNNTAEVNYLTNYGTGSFTIEGWFRADNASTYMGLFRQGSQNAYPQVVVQFPGSSPYNRIAGSIETSTTGTQVDVAVSQQFTLGLWYHYAMVADRTPGAQTLTVYLHDASGALVGSAQSNANVWGTYPINDTYTGTPPNEVRDPVVLGVARTPAPGPNYNYYFDGRLDEVRIWDHARTLQEIEDNVNRQVLAAPGLRHRWALNENAGTTTADTGGTPTTAAQLINGAAWVAGASNVPTFGDNTCEHEATADGTPCPDNVFCDGAETCQAGTCTDGTPPCDAQHCDEVAETCWTCVSDAECYDGQFCNGVETCNLGTHQCQAGTPPDCDDEITCTTDSCNETTDSCDHEPNHAACNDSNPCTDNTCDPQTGDPVTGCVQTPNTGAACDDGDPCTTGDTCQAGTCVPGDMIDCSDGNDCTDDDCTGPATNWGLDFNGTNQYVQFGAASEHPELGLDEFTLEAWIYWEGGGTTTGSGSNGVTGYPLITKGRGEADGDNRDCNFFLAIDSVAPNAGKLAADFESYEPAVGGNNNYPVRGSTVVSQNAWHHVAVTYGDGCWQLYLDGAPDTPGTTCPGMTPRYDSIQRFAIATAIDSGGNAQGAFDGRMDEVRVWNHARSAAQILAGRDRRITSAPGLVGRWGLDEGSGAVATDSTPSANHGTIVNAAPYVNGAPNLPGTQCVHVAVSNGSACDDGDICTSGDTCSGGFCQSGALVPDCCHTAADCNDFNSCTTDACVNNDCVYTPIPNCCDADGDCIDSNDCTADTCDTANIAAADLRVASGDYVDLGRSDDPLNFVNNYGTSSFTVEGWVYIDVLPTEDYVGVFRAGRQGTPGPQVVVQLRYSGGNRWLAASVEPNSATQADAPATYVAGAAVTTGQWYHFAAVVDRATQDLRMYVNGSHVATDNRSWSANALINMLPADTTLLGVARTATPALAYYLNGRMDEVRIWNYARTEAEIQADRLREIRSAPGLVHRWGFNEASGPAIDDPGTFDGTFVGGATRIATNIPTFGDNTCDHTPANQGGACNDGSACTENDVCDNGTCAGTAITCDDGNPCTDDSCNPASGCMYTNVANGTACDDGSACTENDVCDTGTCAGTAITCDDDNPCTDDSCNPASGCVYTNVANGTTCDDGNACTENDACDNGACAGTAITCDDDNPCTDDSCNPPSGCIYTNVANGTTCDDGSACTENDVCDNGTCAGTAITCDDGNPCTDDTCDPVAGCANTPNTAPCNDNNACTTNDTCSGGACIGGEALDCNDGNPCTDDSCDAVLGCMNAHNTAPCDDGLWCTENDLCTAGQCAGTPKTCGDGLDCTTDSCDEAADACVNTYTDTAQITVNLTLEGLAANPLRTRTVTFITTDCQSGRRITKLVPVWYNTDPAVVLLDLADPNADWIRATEGHTLSRRLPLTYAGCAATANFHGADKLLAGDFSNPPWVAQDNRVDIQDFAILSIYWNQPVDPNQSTLADVTGDGWQGLPDFTAIQANFAQTGDPIDNCAHFELPIEDPSTIEVAFGIQLRIPVDELEMPDAELADRNGDGVVDLRDIRLFAIEQHIALTPAFRAKLDWLERTYLDPAPRAIGADAQE